MDLRDGGSVYRNIMVSELPDSFVINRGGTGALFTVKNKNYFILFLIFLEIQSGISVTI